jgi:phosphoribosylformylglycinamidine synthase
VIQREARKPDYLDKLRNVDLPPMPNDLTNALYRILSSPNVASKEWLYSQCDHEVGIRTILKHEDADAAVMGIPNGKAIALTTDCNSRHCYLDPYNGGAGAVAEACRNVAATGGEPLAIVDCCNFGNPENPEVFWQFKEAVRGMADMCKGLNVPCVGGNVSFYNEDGRTGKAVKPCPGVVALGLVDNLDSITPMPFQNPGDVIVMVGETFGELGGSEYYHVVHGLEGGNPPKADPARERKSIDAVLAVIRKGHVRSAHDCSRGGLGVALATMAIKSGLGATIELEKVPSQNLRPDELLFSETHSRFILTTRESDVGPLADSLEMFSIPFARIGNVSNSDSLAFKWHNADFTCSIHEMRKKWEGTIPKYMEGTAE